jgi:hypothetical protein
VVLKDDPVLIYQTIESPGEHLASTYSADGFYAVNVKTGDTVAEQRTVDLDMKSGNQVIEPTVSGRVMSKAIVRKPSNLTPANIKKGATIGGVVGTYEPALKTDVVFEENGEYPIPAGFYGFGKIVIAVPVPEGDVVIPTKTLNITSDNLGEYDTGELIDISEYKYLRITLDTFTDDW